MTTAPKPPARPEPVRVHEQSPEIQEVEDALLGSVGELREVREVGLDLQRVRDVAVGRVLEVARERLVDHVDVVLRVRRRRVNVCAGHADPVGGAVHEVVLVVHRLRLALVDLVARAEQAVPV